MRHRRIIRSTLLSILAGVIGLAVIVAVFHDDIARALVLQLASRIPGLDATIDGNFDLEPAFPFAVDATGVNLDFEGNALAGSRWRLGTVHATIRLGPLLRGVLYIEQLAVTDAELSIPPVPDSAENEWGSSSGIRVPFVEAVQLERVNVSFQLHEDQPAHELEIDRLHGSMAAARQVKLDGSGTLNRDSWKLDATLGSFEQFLDAHAPYPVRLALKAPEWDLEVNLVGTFDDPLRLRGANLDLRANAPDLTPLLAVLAPSAPFAGTATLNAHLIGDWDAIVFSDLDASVEDGERLKLSVTGDAAGLQEGERLDLRVEAAVRDPAVAGFLLPDAFPNVRSIDLRSRVTLDGDRVRIEHLDADFGGDDDLAVTARGDIALSRRVSRWDLESVDLDLRTSATAAVLEPWLPELDLDAGQVIARTHVEGNAQSLSFTNFDLELDGTEPLSGSIRGGFSYDAGKIEAMRISGRSAATFMPSAVDARVELQASDLSAAGALFGHSLVDLGPVAAKARVKAVGDGSIQMTGLDVRSSGDRALRVAATGAFRAADFQNDSGVEDLELELQASGPNGEAVQPLLGALPIEPGPWSLNALLKGSSDSLQVTRFAFESGSDDGVYLKIDGSIDDLNTLLTSSGKSPTGVAFKTRLNAASTQHLGAALGKAVPDFGQLRATFEGRGEKGQWSLANAEAAIADNTGLRIEFSGTATDLLGDSTFEAAFALEAPELQRTVARMGADIRPVSPIGLGGQLQGDRAFARFVGGGDVGETALEVELGSDPTRPYPNVAGVITTPVLRPRDFVGPPGIAESEPGERDDAPTESTDLTQTFWLSRERLPFEYLQAVDLDLEFIADKIEGDLVNTDRLHLLIDTGEDYHLARLNEVKFEDGFASLAVEVDTAMDPPKVKVEGRGSNIDLQALYALSSDSWGVTGARFGFDVDLTGHGRSMYELATAANGTFGNVVENARLEGLNLDLLALKTLDILTGALKSDQASTIECLVAKFNVENGLARTESLYVRTPKLRAAGDGSFDAADESMNVVFNTEAKKGLFKSKAVLRIHGPMRNPIIDKDLKGAAAGAAAGGGVAAGAVFVPTIGIPIAGLSFLGGLTGGSDKKPCGEESNSAGEE